MQQPSKARNGAGSVRWSDSKDRYRGQATRNGKVIKTIYGRVGVKSPAEKMIVKEALKPYLELPEEVDATLTVQTAVATYCNNPKRAASTRARNKAAAKNYVNDLLDEKTGALIERRLGSKRLIDVRPGDVEKTLDAMKSKRGATMDRSRMLVYKMLKAVFKRAVKRGMITRNPVDAIDAPEYARVEKIRVFTPDEQRRLIDLETRNGGRYVALLRLMLSMPLRTCEAIAVQRCVVNLAARRIHICKDLISSAETNYRPTLGPVKTPESDREIFLTDETKAAITQLLEERMKAGTMTPESLLFTAPEGGPIEHARLSARWWSPLVNAAKAKAEEDARKRGDLDYRFPKIGLGGLRHTAIENLKAAGIPVDVVHTLAGHASLSTTMKHYNQPSEERKLQATDQIGSYLKKRGIG